MVNKTTLEITTKPPGEPVLWGFDGCHAVNGDLCFQDYKDAVYHVIQQCQTKTEIYTNMSENLK